MLRKIVDGVTSAERLRANGVAALSFDFKRTEFLNSGCKKNTHKKIKQQKELYNILVRKHFLQLRHFSFSFACFLQNM